MLLKLSKKLAKENLVKYLKSILKLFTLGDLSPKTNFFLSFF